ncbi:MAG: GNAT family N-acetyltransferase [Terracidiphilus sp.]|nr:GNAT family N-acetyltransferase [Terracidiphilus sp.]
MSSDQLLNDPIWNALTTEHAAFALGGALARRYPAHIGPLSGLADQSDAAWDELRSIAGPGGVVVLFLQAPYAPRPGWSLVREGPLSQMVSLAPSAEPPAALTPTASIRRLTAADSPAMVELATLTELGPFREGTHELGSFYGVFEGDRLVSMAGQRMRLPGYVEVSAVCTHPDARGRGYARTLMLQVIHDIRSEGLTPFLHSWAFNHAAIRVYTDLGFVLRHSMHVAALRNDRA